MLKRNKGMILLTSAVMLLPMVVGLLLWSSLPEKVPVHWNAAGEVDGWGSRGMIVFLIPLFILALHWLCLLATCADPKSKDLGGKALGLVLWICPFISLLVSTCVYAVALGWGLSIQIIMPLMFGLLFMIMGNYLPKCKQNYTIGIKVPWALNDEENWNSTHRFAGRIWVIGGAVVMATSVFGSFVVFFAVTLIMGLAPMVYSYLYYRKHRA